MQSDAILHLLSSFPCDSSCRQIDVKDVFLFYLSPLSACITQMRSRCFTSIIPGIDDDESDDALKEIRRGVFWGILENLGEVGLGAIPAILQILVKTTTTTTNQKKKKKTTE